MLQKNQWPQNIKGWLRIELTGSGLVSFINEATRRKMGISQVVWISEDRMHLTIPASEYVQLKPILKQTRTKSRILHKKGLPFFFMRVKKRQFFLYGLLLFFALLFLLTSVVWSVKIEGNETIPDKEILQLLKNEGVYVGQLKYRIPEEDEVQYRLQVRMPQVAWVGFRLEGTRAVLTVVEKKRVNEQEKQESGGSYNLVAKKEAVVYDLNVKRGRSLVEVNDVVKKGQLLVSGRYGDQDTDEGEWVGAKGKVLGEVWYESNVTVPLQRKRKVYTGNREKAWYPYIATQVIRIPFLFPESYDKYETIRKTNTPRIKDYPLPFGWVEEERLETRWVSRKLSVKQAIALGKERAKEDLLFQLGKDGRILDEKVLHPRVDNGKVVMKIHFDVVEEISVKQPVLQGE